jgi:hypothetical protein
LYYFLSATTLLFEDLKKLAEKIASEVRIELDILNNTQKRLDDIEQGLKKLRE